MILEGLQYEIGRPIEKSIPGLLNFLEEKLSSDKKIDFLNRKYKETSTIVSIGFDSINPIRLSIKKEYVKEDTSDNVLTHEDVFHPLFYGFMITNNQYKRLEGEGTEKLNNRQNTNSFSDFFISRKVLDSVLPKIIKLKPPLEIDKGTVRYELLNEFYRVFNEKALLFHQNEQKKVGYDFYLDFNSLIDLTSNPVEKENFIQDLFKETGLELSLNIQSLFSDRTLNGVVYLLDSVCYQSKKIFNIDITTDDSVNNIEELLNKKVNLMFEVPTNEKPTLKKSRVTTLDDENDLPKLTLVEAILIRFITVTINKQGKTQDSGYIFDLKEGNDKNVSLERYMHVVSDAYGNPSILKVGFVDIKKREAFLQKIKTVYSFYYSETLDKDKTVKLFYGKLLSVRDNFTIKQPKEKELIDMYLTRKEYKKMGKVLYDGAYRNITNRVLAFERKHNRSTSYSDLVDFLFILDVLLGNQSEEGRLCFMKRRINMKELVNKEDLSTEELHFLLGGLSALVIKDSRNSSSLTTTFLGQNRTKDILGKINKRIATGVNEIQNLSWVAERMNVILSHYQHVTEKKQMTHEEKFAFISGLLSGLNKEKNNTVDEKGEN